MSNPETFIEREILMPGPNDCLGDDCFWFKASRTVAETTKLSTDQQLGRDADAADAADDEIRESFLQLERDCSAQPGCLLEQVNDAVTGDENA